MRIENIAETMCKQCIQHVTHFFGNTRNLHSSMKAQKEVSYCLNDLSILRAVYHILLGTSPIYVTKIKYINLR